MDTRTGGTKFIKTALHGVTNRFSCLMGIARIHTRDSQFPGIQLENSGHLLMASFAHAVFLSLWHDVHGFGIPYLSVISGEMKRNVCACTNVPGTPSLSIAGI